MLDQYQTDQQRTKDGAKRIGRVDAGHSATAAVFGVGHCGDSQRKTRAPADGGWQYAPQGTHEIELEHEPWRWCELRIDRPVRQRHDLPPGRPRQREHGAHLTDSQCMSRTAKMACRARTNRTADSQTGKHCAQYQREGVNGASQQERKVACPDHLRTQCAGPGDGNGCVDRQRRDRHRHACGVRMRPVVVSGCFVAAADGQQPRTQRDEDVKPHRDEACHLHVVDTQQVEAGDQRAGDATEDIGGVIKADAADALRAAAKPRCGCGKRGAHGHGRYQQKQRTEQTTQQHPVGPAPADADIQAAGPRQRVQHQQCAARDE